MTFKDLLLNPDPVTGSRFHDDDIRKAVIGVRPFRVYLAGKIGKNDYRHSIVPGLRRTWPDLSDQPFGTWPSWPVLPKAVFGIADYVGPYFVSCDHGCAHGNESHATIDCSRFVEHAGDEVGPRSFAHEQCLRAITAADVVLAYIDTLDCYGTLFELGYAHALHKIILVVINSDDLRSPYEDMWFAMYASQILGYSNDPGALLRSWIEGMSVRVDSEAERRFWSAHRSIKSPDLSGLVTQYKVMDGKYRLDFALPSSKIGVEIDGYAYHSDRETFTSDRKRQRELENAGWRIIRFSGKEACDDPEQCVKETIAAVRAFVQSTPVTPEEYTP